MADSMTKVQHHTFAHIKDIVFNDIGLALATAFDDFFPMLENRLVIELFQEFKEGQVADAAVFDDFAHAVVDEALGQRR